MMKFQEEVGILFTLALVSILSYYCIEILSNESTVKPSMSFSGYNDETNEKMIEFVLGYSNKKADNKIIVWVDRIDVFKSKTPIDVKYISVEFDKKFKDYCSYYGGVMDGKNCVFDKDVLKVMVEKPIYTGKISLIQSEKQSKDSVSEMSK